MKQGELIKMFKRQVLNLTDTVGDTIYINEETMRNRYQDIEKSMKSWQEH